MVRTKYYKATYDKEANAIYVYIAHQKKGEQLTTKEVKSMAIIDYNPQGKMVGVEILLGKV